MEEFKEKVIEEKTYILQKARHDLSNLLTTILGNTELLLFGKYELDDKVKAKVELMRNMGNEMMDKLKNLR